MSRGSTPHYYRKRETNARKRKDAMTKPWSELNTHEKFLVGDSHPEYPSKTRSDKGRTHRKLT